MGKQKVPGKIPLKSDKTKPEDAPKIEDTPDTETPSFEDAVKEIRAEFATVMEEMQQSSAAVSKENSKLLAEVEALTEQLKEKKPHAVPADPEQKWKTDLVEVTFINNESPGTECQFVYEGMPFCIQHGYKYMLPKRVAKHLSSLNVPIWEEVYDDKTGQYVIKQIGNNPRFVCQAVGAFDE